MEFNRVAWFKTKPGSGPRHMSFHPRGKFAYLINELSSTIVALSYNGREGSFKELQVVRSLPEGFHGESSGADIHVSPSGTFVYASNRGHDSIVIYRINQQTGRLSYVGHEFSRGKIPRNFAIDPTGKFMLVANQESDTIVTFRIDSKTGELESSGHVARVPSPTCLKFL